MNIKEGSIIEFNAGAWIITCLVLSIEDKISLLILEDNSHIYNEGDIHSCWQSSDIAWSMLRGIYGWRTLQA
jgi:hypothetical protein